jgi:hypothetical protein
LYAELLGDARLYDLLERIDEDLAGQARAAGCRCGAPLHSARYRRKPRGGPAGLGAGYEQRLSFCCAAEGCRKRTTPPSVRFLGRRVYLGAVVVLVSALRQGASPTRVSVLHELFGVGERTLRRWRQWWQRTFAEGAFWRAARGRVLPVVLACHLPRGLIERFTAASSDRVCQVLRFLAPITTQSCALTSGGF